MKVKNSGKYVFIKKDLEKTFYTMKILMGCFYGSVIVATVFQVKLRTIGI